MAATRSDCDLADLERLAARVAASLRPDRDAEFDPQRVFGASR
ncbi:MAG TPA: hypothetical protein VMT16_05630 [Thermoanaerobaculia bacterium]|nr:hypothetical protein [Thermoanaerobaculia bacterium]